MSSTSLYVGMLGMNGFGPSPCGRVLVLLCVDQLFALYAQFAQGLAAKIRQHHIGAQLELGMYLARQLRFVVVFVARCE